MTGMIYWRKVEQGCLGGRTDLLEEGRKVGRWGRDVWVAEMIYWRKVGR